MNLDPQPMPKLGNYENCIGCGRCVLGCTHGAKWDSRQFLQVAVEHGAEVMTNCKVERVVIENGRATGVEARRGWMRQLTEQEAQSFHHYRLPRNLYVADATLIPQSLGNPPILTIIAIAKRISKVCAQEMYAEG